MWQEGGKKEEREKRKVVVWGKRVKTKKWGKNNKIRVPWMARSDNEFLGKRISDHCRFSPAWRAGFCVPD